MRTDTAVNLSASHFTSPMNYYCTFRLFNKEIALTLYLMEEGANTK